MSTTTDRFELLHALKVKGLATDDFLIAMTGLTARDVSSLVGVLTGEGLVVRRETPRMSGTMITAEGKSAYEELGRDSPLAPSARGRVEEVYAAFLPVNSAFKGVCAAWQLDAAGNPNDHSDPDYDAAVIADLGAIHERVIAVLSPAGEAVARLGRYPARLAAALSRIQDGDRAAFARPMSDSYHDVWMELHQDLLLTAQRERDEADEG
jgi:hypothetical protein|nr:MarR family transcriptional regulator [Gordonia sp. UBA5067]